MKIAYILLILSLLSACAEAPVSVPLTYDNIKYLTIESKTEEEIHEISIQQVKSNNRAEYFRVKDNPAELGKLIDQETKALVLKSNQNPRSFRYELGLNGREVNDISKTINLGFNFDKGRILLSDVDKDFLFPQHLLVLFTNLDQIAQIPLDSISGFENSVTNYKVIYEIEVIEAQHRKYLQVFVKEARLVFVPEDKVVYTFKERRNGRSILDSRLLPNGYSLELIAVHSFGFFGRRILDQIRDNSLTVENCIKQEKLKVHDRLLCEYTLYETDQGRVFHEVDVVGGRMVSLSLKTQGKIPEATQNNILNQAANFLKIKPQVFNQSVSGDKVALLAENRRTKDFTVSDELIEWTYFNVKISFSRNAFKTPNNEVQSVFKLSGLGFDKYLAENY